MTATIVLTEGSAPSTPLAGTQSLYVDTSSRWHIIDDAGVDKTLAITTDTLQPATGSLANAKLANMAQSTIKGRAAAAGTGVPVDLTAAQTATILSSSLSLPATDAAWTAATLEANYVTTGTLQPSFLSAYAVPGYRKIANMVCLRGAARCTGAGALMFTLAAGYRPPYDSVFPVPYTNTYSSVSVAYLIIYTNGEVHTTAATNYTYHLDSVRFSPSGA
jgi:hypothetical protein